MVTGMHAVAGIAGGCEHSLATTQGGEVMVFGTGAEEIWADDDGNELDEPLVEVDGRLGLGADVPEVLRPTVVPGLRVEPQVARKRNKTGKAGHGRGPGA